MTKKNIIKAVISILLGVLLCGSAIVGYMPIPEYIVELTCISNMCGGIILIITGIKLLLDGKFLPHIIYHICLVTILLVCIISVVGNFNFKGAFFFLHLINPVAFLIYFMTFINEKKEYIKITISILNHAIVHLM